MSESKKITPRSIDYSKWYQDIVEQADLVDESPVRGCMTFKPYGFAIWEEIKTILDSKIKATGHQNAYFPLLIPKSFLAKEAEHIEGFAQESAVVTHYRLKVDPKTKQLVVDEDAKLEEEYIIRPTSETIIYDSFSRWIQSYRDLPMLINQWANVMRWEMRTKPFIRTAEFLWQEGHTAHTDEAGAEEEALKMLGIYKEFAEEYLGIYVLAGLKSESEKFAGALRTYTIESMMQDFKAIQTATSHNLGTNFAKAFDIKYQDDKGVVQSVWQTSWGMSTRVIGAMIMSHSDDKGLVLPPRIAPTQLVIIPIIKSEKDKNQIDEVTKLITSQNPNIRIHVDNRDYVTVGEKFYEWEKKGIPLRIEIGPRDISNNQVIIIRRDTSVKEIVQLSDLSETIVATLDEIQKNLFVKSKERTENNIYEVETWNEFKDVIENQKGFVLAYFDGSAETEAKIKEETKATTRCSLLNTEYPIGKCIYSGSQTVHKYIFARSY